MSASDRELARKCVLMVISSSGRPMSPALSNASEATLMPDEEEAESDKVCNFSFRNETTKKFT